MRAEELLVLHYDKFSKNAASLFAKMSQSEAFRDLFIRDPAGTVGHIFFENEAGFSKAGINQANRFLFALLSNAKFLKWGAEFQKRMERKALDKGESGEPGESIRNHAVHLDRASLYREVIQAIKEYGDEEMLYSLLVADKEPYHPAPGPLWSPVAVEIFVVAIAVVAVHMVVTQIDFTPFAPNEGVDRTDLQRISGLMADQLKQRAKDVRAAGHLSSPAAVGKGSL